MESRPVPSLDPALDANPQLHALGLIQPSVPIKLHLGCGQYHLDGYINIDYPPAEHTIQGQAAADIYADIVTLRFTPGSVQEIRLHHVFEHFDRPTALGLLCNWHAWLQPAGTLKIETPDLEGCMVLLQSPAYSYAQKQVVIRHPFG